MRTAASATGLIALLSAIQLSSALPALAEGDAAAGKKIFAKCSACHDGVAEKNRIGPHLVALIGRKAGTLESFAGKFSKAMKEAGAAGLVWDETTLAQYLRAPKAFVPGTSMAFAGFKKDQDIADLIAWLKADPKP